MKKCNCPHNEETIAQIGHLLDCPGGLCSTLHSKDWEERFKEEFGVTISFTADEWRYNYGDMKEYPPKPTKVIEFIKKTLAQAVQAERSRVEKLITEEINIAHKEGTPTARLTSLYMKLSALDKENERD